MKLSVFPLASLLLLLLSIPSIAQIPDVIPDEYSRQFRRHERRIDRAANRDADTIVRLDPIEAFPIEPSFYALETGNWGPSYLGANQRAEEIAGKAKRKAVVFVFDTGGCLDHPLLAGKVWNELGRVFTGEAACADGHGHATHVAGIIAGSAPDYPLGIARMIDIRIVPVKVLSNSGSGSFQGITAGVEYANAEAAKLIAAGYFVAYNLSLGGSSSWAPLEEAFQAAEKLGVVVCAANGNTGNTPVQYPGRSAYTLGTAALQQSGSGVTRASYSSYGPETWAAMPGSSILSTWKGGGTAILSGTSMATPHLAGLFAILGAVYPKSSAAQLQAHYVKYAQDLGSPGRDQYYGWGAGIVNPLLDNAPEGIEPEPEPPTCTDGIRNGKETGVDCGGPDCPACEPAKPPYNARVLPVVLEGNWVLGWWVQDNSATAEEYDLDAGTLVTPQGRTNIKVTRLGFDVSSESRYEYEAEALAANAKNFFRNRALGTPATWDVYDAGRYVLFFLDNYATNGFSGYVQQKAKPTVLEFEWEGVPVVIRASDLIDYNK